MCAAQGLLDLGDTMRKSLKKTLFVVGVTVVFGCGARRQADSTEQPEPVSEQTEPAGGPEGSKDAGESTPLAIDIPSMGKVPPSCARIQGGELGRVGAQLQLQGC